MECRKFNNDWEVLKDISLSSGSESIKEGYAYIRRALWEAGKKFLCDIFGENAAYFAGITCKEHIRILAIAVKEEYQRSGLGTRIMIYESQKARKHGIMRFTLRTSMKEEAQYFWRSLGAEIIGRVKDDWEMQLRI